MVCSFLKSVTTSSVAAAIHSVDPQIALAEPRTMTQVRDDMLSSDRFTMILLVGFSCLALLLWAIGIYGVMNFLSPKVRTNLQSEPH
jgi:hypothetical protein